MNDTQDAGKRNWNQLAREFLAAFFFIASGAMLAVRIHQLPEWIHTPINGGGDAHGMASRSQLWLLIFIAGWIYALMSLMNLMPLEAVNTPRPVSTEQRAVLLSSCKAFVGWLKAVFMAGLLLWIYTLVR